MSRRATNDGKHGMSAKITPIRKTNTASQVDGSNAFVSICVADIVCACM